MKRPLLSPLIAAIALVFLPLRSPGQIPENPSPGSCLDTLRASDTVTAVVTLSVRPRNNKEKLPPDFELFFAQEFKSLFVVPNTVGLSVATGDGECSRANKCSKGRLSLASAAYFNAKNDGTLSDITVVDQTLTPSLTNAVNATLVSMSEKKLVPAITTRSLPLRLQVVAREPADSIPRERQLFRVRIPRYQVEFEAANVSLTLAKPKYPLSAERAGVEDSLRTTFTVMPNGSMAPGSFEVHAGQYREFAVAVFEALLKTRYQPGRLGSCPVATWASQSFSFAIRRH